MDYGFCIHSFEYICNFFILETYDIANAKTKLAQERSDIDSEVEASSSKKRFKYSHKQVQETADEASGEDSLPELVVTEKNVDTPPSCVRPNIASYNEEHTEAHTVVKDSSCEKLLHEFQCK